MSATLEQAQAREASARGQASFPLNLLFFGVRGLVSSCHFSSQPSASLSRNVVVKVYEAFTSNKRSNKYIKSICEPRPPNDLGAEGVRQEPLNTITQHKMLTTYRTKGLYQSLDTSPEFKT